MYILAGRRKLLCCEILNSSPASLTTIDLSLILTPFKFLPFYVVFLFFLPTALQLGCVNNFDMLFFVMGLIPWIDEIKFMLISSRHFCIVFDEIPHREQHTKSRPTCYFGCSAIIVVVVFCRGDCYLYK